MADQLESLKHIRRHTQLFGLGEQVDRLTVIFRRQTSLTSFHDTQCKTVLMRQISSHVRLQRVTFTLSSQRGMESLEDQECDV
jgi:hypothetical protein